MLAGCWPAELSAARTDLAKKEHLPTPPRVPSPSGQHQAVPAALAACKHAIHCALPTRLTHHSKYLHSEASTISR